MRMKQYLTNTYYGLWQIIINGGEHVQTIKDENDVETKVPPKTVQAILARQKERKAKSILLLAIPDEYQLRFHIIKDAKSLWAAIKSSFDDNVESKKMQKNVLKQPFENFFVSDTEGLDKAYDSSTFIMEQCSLDFEEQCSLDYDDLYNNLKVFEADIKGSFESSSNSQNVAFLSAEDTSSSNEVNTTNGVSTAYTANSVSTASVNVYTLNVKYLKQIDHDDLEEMDLKWQVSMLSMRVECLTIIEGAILPGNVEQQEIKGNRNGDAGYRSRDNTRRTVPVETSDALVVQDNALIKNKVVYEEKIAVLEFEVKDKSNAITRLKNQLDETLREKDDLKAKLEQFETSSKNLNKLINSQLSAKDKTGLGYGDQLNENDLSSSELFNSVFDSRSTNRDDNQTNDRFKKDNGYHVVPPLLIGNYMPLLADLSFAGLDDFVYRPTENKTRTSVSQVEASTSQTSNTSVEMPRVEFVRPSGVIIED
ncbi:hypothetical protein Tco_0126858 [Tanacetum coccineum]